MSDALERAAEVRARTITNTPGPWRAAFGQHLTPPETATLAVSLFSDAPDSLRCLDLGAGTGMLSVALAERYPAGIATLDAIEIDPDLAAILEHELSLITARHAVIVGDALTDLPDRLYDRIILNPPYMKMSAHDARQQALPTRSPNVYTAFLMVALAHLAPGGECVAIVPRSWMNGEYFAPFRRWALGSFSLDTIHVYESRSEVFRDTSVLQETMIARFSALPQRESIVVSTSYDANSPVTTEEHEATSLICGRDKIVRIAPEVAGPSQTVSSIGLCPSTGKVVDFRSRDRISFEHTRTADVYPLVYAGNFRSGRLGHPADIGKPQWFRADDDKSRAQLIQPGAYVAVKRFSSKEERRRVVAFPLIITTPIALENHLTFIHEGSPRRVVPLDSADLACGLAMWLNSSYVDTWFRGVSGSTQVNASDVRATPCPPRDRLTCIGTRWSEGLSQDAIDAICAEVTS